MAPKPLLREVSRNLRLRNLRLQVIVPLWIGRLAKGSDRKPSPTPHARNDVKKQGGVS
jgi:hypothetical protein